MDALKEAALLTIEEKLHFRKRTFDCPAVEICKSLGTISPSCYQGGKEHRAHGKCLPSIVILFNRMISNK
ncbi:MAG: hypothetical protein V3S39_06775 [Thermodesulfobacteriota bacterium]